MPFIRTSTPSIQYHYVHIFRLLFAVFYFSSTYLKAYLTDDRYQLNETCNYYLSTFLLNSTHSLYYYNHKPKFLLSKKVKTQNTSHVTTYVHLLAASTTTTETTKCFNTHTTGHRTFCNSIRSQTYATAVSGCTRHNIDTIADAGRGPGV